LPGLTGKGARGGEPEPSGEGKSARRRSASAEPQKVTRGIPTPPSWTVSRPWSKRSVKDSARSSATMRMLVRRARKSMAFLRSRATLARIRSAISTARALSSAPGARSTIGSKRASAGPRSDVDGTRRAHVGRAAHLVEEGGRDGLVQVPHRDDPAAACDAELY